MSLHNSARLPGLPALPGEDDIAGRLTWLRDRYMKNSRDFALDDVLSEILQSAPDGTLTALPQRIGLIRETRGLLLTGATGDGKTALIRRCLQLHPAIGLTDGKGPGRALYVRVPAEATLKGVATDILVKTGYHTVASKLRTTEVWDMAIHRLALQGITILWIDEAHHMLEIQKEVTSVLRRLKTLMQGDNSLVLIVSGIHKLEEKIQSDPETSERFMRMRLGPYRTARERTELWTYIERCCSLLGLSPPGDQHLVERLELATSGSLGRSLELTYAAIRRALHGGTGRLTLEHYQRSFDLKRGFRDDGPFDPEDWPALKEMLDKKGWAALAARFC